MRAELLIKPAGPAEVPNLTRRHYVLREGETFVVGRGRDADIHLDDLGVSRQHVSLELRPEGVFVTDLGSRNGALLGGQPLAANTPTLHREGEVLALGDHTITIRLRGREPQRGSSGSMLAIAFLPRDEFEILGQAGSGGLCVVYAARQKMLDRKVAIKILHSKLDPTLQGQRRFMQEARLYCQIKSPYVVELYDIRTKAGQPPYLILELVQGPTAKARLGAGVVPVPEALRICEDVARALIATHAAGIVHRDVKPSNILLTYEGRAKLGDFGLAKRLEGGEALTNTDYGLGSLPYVSPEQATRAKAVDIRSDIYSLGATLFHLLAGRPPFRFRKTPIMERIKRIQSEPPPSLGQFREDCPADVDALVQDMLAKSADERPQTPETIAEALADLRQTHYPDWVFDPHTLYSATWEVRREDLFGS